jgi:hypothetical protein
MAAPYRDERIVLLKEFPNVMPNPLSSGSHKNLPYASVLLTRILSDLIISRQFMYISSFLTITFSPDGFKINAAIFSQKLRAQQSKDPFIWSRARL